MHGAFNLHLRARNLKTNYAIDAERAAGSNEELEFTIKSPENIQNLSFLIAHRILIIALRRNAIIGEPTIEELLSGTNHRIAWKETFRDIPIMRASKARGL